MRIKQKTNNVIRPVIEPTRLYSRRESATACGVGRSTLCRAYKNGYLKAYRIGARVLHSGQHLLDWMEAGGYTGRTTEDFEAEKGISDREIGPEPVANNKARNQEESLATAA